MRIKDTHLRQKEFILNKIILAGRNMSLNINGGNNMQSSQASLNIKHNNSDEIKNFEDLNKTKSGNFSVILNEDFCLESSFKRSWNKNQFNLLDLSINNIYSII